ncbi:hypothetical protein [Halarcobacter anaerophilus]|jgi:hypothetical protein|uniref:hypothetical protein n=1 Tax=Halarcobacter anaerophilus TaxID=877500 RepID=UPI0005C8DF01|nr:hypothetical protein [Halarcobacter anaerophilus]
MAENSFVYIVMFLLFVGLGVILYKKSTIKSKPAHLKKEEIIKQYEYEMLKLISKYEKDSKLLSQKKVEFLKQANKELHQNIFFDENEAKALISKLASF